MVTFGLLANNPSGIAVNALQPKKVKEKSVAFGQFAKRFSGMDFKAEQPEKVSEKSVTFFLKVNPL